MNLTDLKEYMEVMSCWVLIKYCPLRIFDGPFITSPVKYLQMFHDLGSGIGSGRREVVGGTILMFF